MRIDHRSQTAQYEPRGSDFYNYRAIEDEMAASLLAKNIRKLLQRSPNVIAKQIASTEFYEDNSRPPNAQECGDNELFQSDTSLSSLCSTLSTDSTESIKWGSNQKESTFKVCLPRGMLNRMVRDIVRMGEGEPNGIRGCKLFVELADEDAVYNIGKIHCDPKIPTSHTLRLRLMSGSPPDHFNGSIMLLSRLFKSSQQRLHIRPGYVIEKVRH